MSQEDQILSHLKSGRSLTAIEALSLYGVFRLAARIEELKAQGYPIQTKIVGKNGKRYAEYELKAAEAWKPNVCLNGQSVGSPAERSSPVKAQIKPLSPTASRLELFPKEKPRYTNHWELKIFFLLNVVEMLKLTSCFFSIICA